MAYIIGVVQRKGGAGKTTLAVNLGGAFAQSGVSVALVDADPQGSASDWAAMGRLRYPVYRLPIETDDLRSWGEAITAIPCEVLTMDTPAFLNKAVYSAVVVADVLLIPCGPSGLDLEATKQTLNPGTARDLGADPREFPDAGGADASRRTGRLRPPGRAAPRAPDGLLARLSTGESVSTLAPNSPWRPF
jgi:hypothetical protein